MSMGETPRDNRRQDKSMKASNFLSSGQSGDQRRNLPTKRTGFICGGI